MGNSIRDDILFRFNFDVGTFPPTKQTVDTICYFAGEMSEELDGLVPKRGYFPPYADKDSRIPPEKLSGNVQRMEKIILTKGKIRSQQVNKNV